MPDPHELSTDELQFDRAETASAGRTCAFCKRLTGPTYYQVQAQTACESCAKRVEAAVVAPPGHSLLRAAVYGAGAAVAGCAIYAGVALIFHVELALISILVGYMVGRAVRYGSKGLGGRPQQILAALLTYFAVSTSYMVVAAYSFTELARQSSVQLGKLILPLFLLAGAAPFIMVKRNPSAVLSLVIIFFGVWRAWKMTGRPQLVIMGPYQSDQEAK